MMCGEVTRVAVLRDLVCASIQITSISCKIEFWLEDGISFSQTLLMF